MPESKEESNNDDNKNAQKDNKNPIKNTSAVLHNFLDRHQLRGYYPPV
jgi:hypothetical protein